MNEAWARRMERLLEELVREQRARQASVGRHLSGFTAHEVERLPLLISRKLFLCITGLTKRELYALVRQRAVRVWKPAGAKHARYYASEARRIGAVGGMGPEGCGGAQRGDGGVVKGGGIGLATGGT